MADSIRNNKMNVRVLYNRLLDSNKVAFANVVWCSLAMPKHRFIFWQAALGHLLTRDKLLMCHLHIASDLCSVCEEVQESHSHLFFECSFSHQLRTRLENWLGKATWLSRYADWHLWMEGKPKGLVQKVAAATFAAAVYLIWKNRNKCIFEHRSWSIDFVVHQIRYAVKVRLSRAPKIKIKSRDLAVFDYMLHL
ncbi:uncharacterized protein LOC133806378 [Humulus lupulus]|uniref:uncharacterized protein LOC133806378 n=1 Tax=Humulus lupulus TaxID=3486 RepID=UPI002B402EB2|nr:uncharacterized protein LOC133806378 [Humulus lupulus]